MSFSVVDNLLADLMNAAGFRLEPRQRGKFSYHRLKWPGGTKLADVLAAYDLNRLQRFEYPADFEEPLPTPDSEAAQIKNLLSGYSGVIS